jgi:copper chaperone CopZ
MSRLQVTIITIVAIALVIVLVLVIAPKYLKSNVKSPQERQIKQSVVSLVGQLAPGEKVILVSKLGMTCISCRAAVAAALSKVDGVVRYSIDLDKDQVIVRYSAKRTTPKIVKQAIIKGGYKVGSIRELGN